MNAEAWVLLATLAVMILGGAAVWASRVMSGAAALKKVEHLERDLAEFKERVARDYATAAMVAAVERSVGDAINRLTDRLDRILERGSVATRTPARTKP